MGGQLVQRTRDDEPALPGDDRHQVPIQRTADCANVGGETPQEPNARLPHGPPDRGDDVCAEQSARAIPSNSSASGVTSP